MKNKYDTIEIVNRIKKAAVWYKENIVGKTFLVLYEGRNIKIHFKAENFLHLCGVDTFLYAKEFYRKATNGTLRPSQIGFSAIHPYIFADIKTRNLINALSILQRDSLIITEISTQSRSYELGTTDLEVVICFDAQLDDDGNKINDIFVPYSLRVEEIANNRYKDVYQVDYVLSKETGTKLFSQIEYGDANELSNYLCYYGINIPRLPELSENEKEDDDYER